jgi:2-C-methyl-D-erythritol 4-phosphate cytidylyltransferase
MIAAILLAGGQGLRMGGGTPKQFRELRGQGVALYSARLFASMPSIHQLIIVAPIEHRPLFNRLNTKVSFALPGERRQDSVLNGLKQIAPDAELVCVHDAARPLITEPLVNRVIEVAQQMGCAAAALPVTSTIKRATPTGQVLETLDRSTLWELQTPQVLWPALLRSGLEKALELGITLTDDLAAAELMGAPVQLVQGDPRNIKLTTPLDWQLAQLL